MFMKQYNYKPRSGSQSSQSGSGKAIERTDNAARADSPPAAKVDTSQNTTSPVSAAIAGRRRSSDVSGKFSGLHGYKRNSQDASAAERKASWADAAPGNGGILSGMWNNFTKGTK